MRSITRLSPRDPADEMARNIGTRAGEMILLKRMREVVDLVEQRVEQKREALNASR